MKFELEKRALIKPKAVKHVQKLLKITAKKKQVIRRFSLIFWDHSEVEPKTASSYDFRIRITGTKALFTLKYGDWRGGGREEYEFNFDPKELGSVVNLMRVLGYKWGTTTNVERSKYSFNGMEVVLDYYLDDGQAILEVEKQVSSKRDFGKWEEKIDEVFRKWKLVPLTKKGMVQFVRYTNSKKENYFNLVSGNVNTYVAKWLKKTER